MDLIEFRTFCLSLPMAEETTPFDEETLVYKIGGKIFACAHMIGFGDVALKCDSVQAEELRDAYPDITEPKYFNKKHWISVKVNGDLSSDLVHRLIEASYGLVLRKSVVPKSLREELIAVAEKRGFLK